MLDFFLTIALLGGVTSLLLYGTRAVHRLRKTGMRATPSTLIGLVLLYYAIRISYQFAQSLEFGILGTLAVALCTGPVACFLVVALIVRFMPRQQWTRAGGLRKPRVDPRWLYALLWVILFALIALLIWNPHNLERSWYDVFRLISLLSLVGVAGGWLLERSRRFKSQRHPEAILAMRRYTLYLRAFNTDKKCFHSNPYVEKDYCTERKASWAERHEDPDKDRRTFTGFFSACFAQHVAPLVGLGDPRDYLPHEGGDFIYAADSVWKATLDQLMARSTCIIMAPSISGHVAHELGRIFEQGCQDRLFVLTPPRPTGRLAAWRARNYDRMRDLNDVEWGSFQTLLNEAGAVGNVPGTVGAVIGFGRDKTMVILAQDLTTPREYAIAVSRYLYRDILNPAV